MSGLPSGRLVKLGLCYIDTKQLYVILLTYWMDFQQSHETQIRDWILLQGRTCKLHWAVTSVLYMARHKSEVDWTCSTVNSSCLDHSLELAVRFSHHFINLAEEIVNPLWKNIIPGAFEIPLNTVSGIKIYYT